MNKNFRTIVAALALTATLVLSACAETSKRESTGDYVDDSAITAKIKTAILGEPGLKSLQIGVETYQNSVQLSGFVDSAQARVRAAEIAASLSRLRHTAILCSEDPVGVTAIGTMRRGKSI